MMMGLEAGCKIPSRIVEEAMQVKPGHDRVVYILEDRDSFGSRRSCSRGFSSSRRGTAS